MDRIRVNESDLLEAIREASSTAGADEGFCTAEQIRQASGLAHATVNRKIRAMFDAGMIDCKMVQKNDITGRPHPTPGYKMRANDEHTTNP